MTETISSPTGTGQAVAVDDAPGVTCTVFRHGKLEERLHDLSRISEVLKEEENLVWLDVVDPEPRDLALLQQEFDLHPLAVDDAIHAHQRPKIDSYGAYWF